MKDQKETHWEAIYTEKEPSQMSWTQKIPKTSIDFINSFQLSKTAKIIDIGGGESLLIDYLLEVGYENLTVLDISKKALEKTKKRLGYKANQVNWIVSDINKFEPTENYDIWHDRATFHFLTSENEISNYLDIAKKAVNGFLTIGTFSEDGPTKCSGLDVKRYSKIALEKTFQKGFQKLKCIAESHTTPFNTSQNFTFCSFKKTNI